MDISVVVLPWGKDLILPEYKTLGSSGMDLRAAIDDDVVIDPGQKKMIPTGLILEIPDGYEGQVRPRSGLAGKEGVTLVNSPTTIDSDYRGEVIVALWNTGDKGFVVKRGDRVAQLVIAPVVRIQWRRVEFLSVTDRGDGGFGHTGV